MKQLASNYTFNAAAKTVTLNNLNISLSQILMVAAKGKVLYSFADGAGAANYVQGDNSVLTLQNTTGLTNTDKLTIFYDDLTDDSPNFINRYALTLNYQQQLTFDNQSYGIGTVLIPENRGRNNIEIISSQPVYAIFGEDATDIYNNGGNDFATFSSYCTTYGTLLSANVSYRFTKEQSTTGKVFLWTNSSPLTYRAEIIASERSSNFISNNFINYSKTLQNYSLSANRVSMNEESNVTIALSCRNVANGTNVPYSIFGLSDADLSSGSLNGNFIINNNIGTITLGLVNDNLTEGTETAVLSSAGRSITILIDDYIPVQINWNMLGAKIISTASGDSSTVATVSINDAGNRVAVYSQQSGYNRIYSYDGSSWVKLGADITGRGSKLNSVGDRIAVFTDSRAMIYSYDGSSWIKLGADITRNPFGGNSSICINDAGNIVAIGESFNDGNGPDSGAVGIYSYNGSSWVQLGQDIIGKNVDDRSGYSVALNSAGDRVAIGAPFARNSGATTTVGHVRVYSYNGSSWVQLGQDIYGEVAGDRLGWSVDINSVGDRVVIGAPYNDGNGTDSGRVSVYSYNGSSWVKLGLSIDGEGAGDNCGYSVAINNAGDRIAIGAPVAKNANGIITGHIRVFSYIGGGWLRTGQDIDDNNNLANNFINYGWSVGINSVGDRVAGSAKGSTMGVGYANVWLAT